MRTLRPAVTGPLRQHATTSPERSPHVQHMHSIEHRMQDVGERQASMRMHRIGGRRDERRSPAIRRHIGEWMVRTGRRIAGDAMTTPAWQG